MGHARPSFYSESYREGTYPGSPGQSTTEQGHDLRVPPLKPLLFSKDLKIIAKLPKEKNTVALGNNELEKWSEVLLEMGRRIRGQLSSSRGMSQPGRKGDCHTGDGTETHPVPPGSSEAFS